MALKEFLQSECTPSSPKDQVIKSTTATPTFYWNNVKVLLLKGWTRVLTCVYVGYHFVGYILYLVSFLVIVRRK